MPTFTVSSVTASPVVLAASASAVLDRANSAGSAIKPPSKCRRVQDDRRDVRCVEGWVLLNFMVYPSSAKFTGSTSCPSLTSMEICLPPAHSVIAPSHYVI